MNKSKKFFDKNKNLIIGILVFIVVLLLFFCIYKTVLPEKESAIYGDRLDGMEAVELSSSDKSNIEKALNDFGKDITIRTQGKIINITITLNDDVNRDTAKTLGEKVLKELSKKQIDSYDIQMFVSKNDSSQDAGSFPIIGYKQISNKDFSWTKDR